GQVKSRVLVGGFQGRNTIRSSSSLCIGGMKMYTVYSPLLAPSCCVIFDLEGLWSFEFVLSSKIFKSYPCLTLSSLPSYDLVSCCQHAHTLHHVEILLSISLDNLCIDNLDIFKGDLEYQSCRNALDSSYLLELIIGTSQSRQHESRKSPTAVLFDVDTGRISIRHCEY
ncbi:hypothetical protein Tco_1088319, partial [Tanacetum coccineum]